MENEKDKKIEAYINREMPAKDRKAFEAELAADPELRGELQLYQLTEKAIELNGQARLRTLLEDVRQQTGPLPDPKIGLIDRIRFFFYSRLNRRITVGFLFLFTLSVIWMITAAYYCPLSNISDGYFIEPMLEAHASPSDATTPTSILAKSREFYENNQSGNLQQLAKEEKSRSIASFYLAHLYLKNKNFQLAEEAFNQVLAEKDNLTNYYSDIQDFGKIKFNLLLSKLGKTKDWNAALAELTTLQRDPDLNKSGAREKVAQLEKDLTNPFLRLLCFKL